MLAPDICAVKQTEATIRALKRLARETGAAVILPAHFSRRVEKRELKQPLWRDLPGGVITGGADVVLSVLREECYDPDSTRKGTADICVMRNRHGNVGMRILVKLATNNASKLAGDNASTCPLQKELQAES